MYDLRGVKKIFYQGNQINKMYVGSVLTYTKQETFPIIYTIKYGTNMYDSLPKGVTIDESVVEGDKVKLKIREGNINFSSKTNITTIEKLKYIQPSSCSDMFFNCSSLTKIDLSEFNTNNVTDMHRSFASCGNLVEFIAPNLNTTNVTKMDWLFYGCKSLTRLDLTSFDTRNVTDINSMFKFCENLMELNLSNFDTRNVKLTFGAFTGVPSYCRIYVGRNWTLSEQQTGFTGKFIRV